MEIDRLLRERLQTATEAAVLRALERAGNRLKGRAGTLRDTLRSTPPLLAAATAGPRLIADAGLTTEDLLAGAWDDLIVRYQTWGEAAVDDTMGVAAKLVGEWKVGYPEALKARYAESMADSVDYFTKALDGLAEQHLFDPKGVLHPDPESLVPTGFVRHVLGIAGGQADIATNGYAYVVLDAQGGAVGGIATGKHTMGALGDHDATLQGYRWVYGPARRQTPFDPHLKLDGAVFRTFTDAVLNADSGKWPYVDHYIPGDHPYCRCDFEPIILTPDQAAAIDAANPKPPPPPPPLPQMLPDKPLLKDLDAYVQGLDPVIAHYEAVGDSWMAENMKAEQAAIKAKADKIRAGNAARSKAAREKAKAGKQAAPPPPPPPTGVSSLGAPPAGTRSVRQATAFESVHEAQRGGTFAFDAGDVEMLEVNTRGVQAMPWRNAPAVEVRFKLTGEGAERFYGALDPKDWTTHDAAWFNYQGIYSPGTIQAVDWQQTIEIVNRGADEARFTEGVRTFTRTTEVDGRRVHVQVVRVAADNRKAPYAMHNSVRMYVEGGTLDDEMFARVVERLGLTDKVRYPTGQDVRNLVEARLVSTLSPQRYSAAMSRSTVEQHLRQIAAQYGITPEDIVFREGADGRLAAFLTDDATTRLVTDAKVTHFRQSFSSSTPERIADLLAAPQGGLMSTTQRWTDGLPFGGMSSRTDLATGGGDFVFTRQRTGPVKADHGHFIIRNDRLKRLDWFAYTEDCYGNTSPAVHGWYPQSFGDSDFVANLRKGVSKGNGNQETMFRHRIAWDEMHGVALGTRMRADVIAELRRRGITHLGSRTVEDFILDADVLDEHPLKPAIPIGRTTTSTPRPRSTPAPAPTMGKVYDPGKKPPGMAVAATKKGTGPTDLWSKMPYQSKAMSAMLQKYGVTNGAMADVKGYVSDLWLDEVEQALKGWAATLQEALAGKKALYGKPIGDILNEWEAEFAALLEKGGFHAGSGWAPPFD